MAQLPSSKILIHPLVVIVEHYSLALNVSKMNEREIQGEAKIKLSF